MWWWNSNSWVQIIQTRSNLHGGGTLIYAVIWIQRNLAICQKQIRKQFGLRLNSKRWNRFTSVRYIGHLQRDIENVKNAPNTCPLCLFNADWSNVLNADSLDDAADSFNENVLKILDKHAPATRKRMRNGNPPWVDDNLLQGIKERDYLKKISSRTGLP